jgi:P27 family predicted phage terminase small subunit
MRGNPGHRALNLRQPVPSGSPTCPSFLQGEARREWRRILRALEPLGLATTVDRAALAAYCQLWGRWVAAEAALMASGTVIPARRGTPMLAPQFYAAQAILSQLRALLQEFGLTPLARTRLKAAEAPEHDTGDELTAFRQAHPRSSGA